MAAEEALTLGLTPDERGHYEREGWVIKRKVFPRDECAALVERMTAVHDAGAPGYPGPPRAADDWNGFGNPHLYDEEIARWMLDQRLRAPLSDAMGGDEPEGIKSYWWYKVQQGFTTRHCDGTALPSCTGVWVPMVDVDGGVEVGTLALQSRSHRGRRIDHDFVQRSGPYTTHSADGEILAPLVAEIYEENERNGCELIKVVAEAGDAVIFHGHLFHHAVFGQDSERFRPVLACHYVPAGYRHWPHVLWERIDFNHERRWSDGTDVESEAARVNARLPQHPAMPSMRSPFAPSLLPARREGLRVCTTQQVTEMDTLGYTVFREAFSRAEISAIRDEIDVLEARRWAGGSSGGGGDRDINSNPDAITFSSGLVMESEVTRAFCGAEFFSDVCWDVLHAEDCRLYNEQAVYKKPAARPDGSNNTAVSFPFHQDNGYGFVEPLQYLTAWVALTDATTRNGCPRVIPKLFRRGPLQHSWDDEQQGLTVPGLRDDDAEGDVALFWSLTPHSTGPNETDSVRKAYILQFMTDGWENSIKTEKGGDYQKHRNVYDEQSPAVQERQYFVLRRGEHTPPPPLGGAAAPAPRL